MKKVMACVVLIAAAAFAQQGSAQNPVTDNVRQRLARQSKILVAAAEAMPAEKYSYKPTEGNMTFGHLMTHITGANNFVCSKIAGQEHKSDVKDSDGKDKIVEAMKDSMEFCTKAMDGVKDADLNQEVEMFGGRKAPKAAAVIELPVDWADHYGAAALYLRLNGILPPTAQPRPGQKAAPKE
ncbi:MAG: DinB family protein [Terriglobales bacterium]